MCADRDRTTPRSPQLSGPLGWVANPLPRRGLRIPAYAAISLALVALSGLAAFLLLQLASAAPLPAPLSVLAGLSGSALAVAAWLGGAALLLTAPFWITASVLDHGRRQRRPHPGRRRVPAVRAGNETRCPPAGTPAPRSLSEPCGAEPASPNLDGRRPPAPLSPELPCPPPPSTTPPPTCSPQAS
ncbi:hypothetical protein [Streptomyces sp. NPDC059816]|uniref:hypothetical protein n=1 Tax=Streptomyces sp. NPDC059816 TaxID=3346960 RepID=UPI003664179E